MAGSIKEFLPALPDEKIDMLAATSVLQQKASEIRAQRVNWQSYLQSQMISQEDYNFVIKFDGTDAVTREKVLREERAQCARTFLNLLGHVSKDQTIQYILIMIDDMLQEDSSRVEIFREHAARKHESVWGPFLNLLNRPDGFITNMTSRIIAKIACWGSEPMDRSDLHFYLTWLKDQLKQNCDHIKNNILLEVHVSRPSSPDMPGGFDNSGEYIDDNPANKEGLGFREEVEPDGRGEGGIGKGEVDNESSKIRDDSAELEKMSKDQRANEYMQSVARCLQMMLRIDEYRFAFVSVDGISTLLQVLSGRVNFQVQYQLTFCLWVLTFNPVLAEKMNKFNVIPILADILSDSVKEKVTRIILAVFRNLIEKVEDGAIAKEHCIAMVQCKVLKQLSILEQRKFDDEDISSDIEYLNEKLQTSVQDLSSFDEYATEVKSGRLEWTPVHKSAKFWRENAPRLVERNMELLKILVRLLESSQDPLVLSVASFDVGEFVRHYPRGKKAIEQLGGKQLVMQLLGHNDPNVRYEALLAVQKLMVHNWEYLGRQLEKEQTQGGKPTQGGASTMAAKA